MTDFIPIALIVGCLFATLGLVHLCEWLQPRAQATQRDEHATPPATHATRGGMNQ